MIRVTLVPLVTSWRAPDELSSPSDEHTSSLQRRLDRDLRLNRGVAGDAQTDLEAAMKVLAANPEADALVLDSFLNLEFKCRSIHVRAYELGPSRRRAFLIFAANREHILDRETRWGFRDNRSAIALDNSRYDEVVATTPGLTLTRATTAHAGPWVCLSAPRAGVSSDAFYWLGPTTHGRYSLHLHHEAEWSLPYALHPCAIRYNPVNDPAESGYATKRCTHDCMSSLWLTEIRVTNPERVATLHPFLKFAHSGTLVEFHDYTSSEGFDPSNVGDVVLPNTAQIYSLRFFADGYVTMSIVMEGAGPPSRLNAIRNIAQFIIPLPFRSVHFRAARTVAGFILINEADTSNLVSHADAIQTYTDAENIPVPLVLQRNSERVYPRVMSGRWIHPDALVGLDSRPPGETITLADHRAQLRRRYTEIHGAGARLPRHATADLLNRAEQFYLGVAAGSLVPLTLDYQNRSHRLPAIVGEKPAWVSQLFESKLSSELKLCILLLFGQADPLSPDITTPHRAPTHYPVDITPEVVDQMIRHRTTGYSGYSRLTDRLWAHQWQHRDDLPQAVRLCLEGLARRRERNQDMNERGDSIF